MVTCGMKRAPPCARKHVERPSAPTCSHFLHECPVHPPMEMPKFKVRATCPPPVPVHVHVHEIRPRLPFFPKSPTSPGDGDVWGDKSSFSEPSSGDAPALFGLSVGFRARGTCTWTETGTGFKGPRDLPPVPVNVPRPFGVFRNRVRSRARSRENEAVARRR